MMTRIITPVIFLASMLFSCVSAAERALTRAEREMQQIQLVVQQNFTASNNKDVAGVIGTMTPDFPNQEQFTDELRQFFEDVDCYMRPVSVTLVDANGSEAVVRVVQETRAGKYDEELPYSEFRERSAMLPPWELCEFNLVMHKIRGKWLIHEMGSMPQEVTREEDTCQSDACRLSGASMR